MYMWVQQQKLTPHHALGKLIISYTLMISGEQSFQVLPVVQGLFEGGVSKASEWSLLNMQGDTGLFTDQVLKLIQEPVGWLMRPKLDQHLFVLFFMYSECITSVC